MALSAEARAARERAKEEARLQRAAHAEVRGCLARVLKAVEYGGGDATYAAFAYEEKARAAANRASGKQGGGGGGPGGGGAGRTAVAVVVELRIIEDEVWSP